MSVEYDNYLKNHKHNVKKAFEWIRDNVGNILPPNEDLEWQICMNHDTSKSGPEEYEAYDKYFYGGNRSHAVLEYFKFAWLHHIHHNPHHWQHWVLIGDDPKDGDTILDMPFNYIIEMICDWWSFSWNNGDLYSIFKWYDDRKDYIKFSGHTRLAVESILAMIKINLDVLEGEKKDD